ncbi:MAG: hypothetical protein PQJ50_15135 [Spirochaetales bacterium]|nr:hypothetical protein [Spirochaetales bacterium]
MKQAEEILTKHGIIYGILAGEDGTIIEEFGDRSSLKYSGVAKNYFGTEEIIQSTKAFLMDKPLPQTVVQGDQCCILTILNENVVSGFFFIDDSHVLIRKKRVKEINDDIQNAFRIPEID